MAVDKTIAQSSGGVNEAVLSISRTTTDVVTESPSSEPVASLTSPGITAVPRGTWVYRLLSTVFLVAVLGGLTHFYSSWKPALDAFIRPAAANKPKPRPPLVSLASVTCESVPQFINCLGTVAAFNVVSVKSRVDGELMEVAFTEGQLVEQGQLLARIDPRGFEAARDQVQAQLDRDQATLDLAKLTHNRMKQLSVSDAASQQELDEKASMVRQSQANVAIDRASLANAELQLSFTKIEAPIRGRVGLRVVDRGNIVKASDASALVVITQLQPISVLFAIPQDDIPRVRSRLAEANSVEVLAFDRSFQRLIETGKLMAADNQVDASTGMLKLKARFENESENLFPNQFVNIRLLVKEWKNALVIPSSAVQNGPEFSYVYVAKLAGEDSTVDIRKVVVNFADAGRTVIESGVEEGESVVVEGTDKLQPGGKITLPGAKPPGAKPPSAMPPGAMPPGAMPPGAMPPGAMSPGAKPDAPAKP